MFVRLSPSEPLSSSSYFHGSLIHCQLAPYNNEHFKKGPYFCAHLWSSQGVDGRGLVEWSPRAAKSKSWQNGKQIEYFIRKLWLYPQDILSYLHKITGISIKKIATFLKFVVSVEGSSGSSSSSHHYWLRGLNNYNQIKSVFWWFCLVRNRSKMDLL